ncbi:MAG TPA: protein-glutamate O-methyltransferase CheR [Candidatus Dormibacteraeota bacterium]
MRSTATKPETTGPNLEEIEIKLLLEAMSLRYGYDFKEYAVGPLRRSILTGMAAEGMATISAYQDRLLRDACSMQRLLRTVGVNVTSMFREPATWRCLRGEVFPVLRTFPSIRIWSVGCASGEEDYSLAITLDEEGLYDRSSIYATDLNETSIAMARRGSYPLERVREYDSAYLLSGGRSKLSDHYTVSGSVARFRRSLQKNITWAEHNLVTDASFNDFHLILCTNVLIYFGPALQERVHRLLHESLVRSGFLVLGQRESLVFSPESSSYERVQEGLSVYRKIR